MAPCELSKFDSESTRREHLFDDSLLVWLARTESCPLPSSTHPWIVGVSIIFWLLLGFLSVDEQAGLSIGTMLLVVPAVGVFIASWTISVARERRFLSALRLLNRCRKELLFVANFIGKALSDIDQKSHVLFRRGTLLPADSLRDLYLLAQIKIAIEDRSENIKRLLISGTRRDLQNALRLLKSPCVVHSSASCNSKMTISLVDLSATALTLLEGVQAELDDIWFSEEEPVESRRTA